MRTYYQFNFLVIDLNIHLIPRKLTNNEFYEDPE